jgi:hypothetical protein
MLNCKQASLLASRAMDERLPFREIMALRLHLWLCRNCTRFTKQLNFLRNTASHSKSYLDFRLTDEARQRIAQVLENQQIVTQNLEELR